MLVAINKIVLSLLLVPSINTQGVQQEAGASSRPLGTITTVIHRGHSIPPVFQRYTRHTSGMRLGLFKLVDGFVLRLLNHTNQIGSLSSFIVSEDGNQILALSKTRYLISLNGLSLMSSAEQNITGSIHKMSISSEDIGDAGDLSIDGVYKGNGEGKLYVSSGRRVTRLSNGVRTAKGEDIVREMQGVKSILKIRSTDGHGLLLMVCDVYVDQQTEEQNTAYTFDAFVYNETSSDASNTFTIQPLGAWAPVDMAQLPNGDVMIIFRGRAGPSVDRLAVRQDPETKKIFVYMASFNDTNAPAGDFKS
ncbi:hypothetical protein FOL47_003948 [Perkinsus chesapeaki]|uniref:Uncharacterized protein n=1 Tax=Perkinsus chesapeaki TaxID=330153 RepID=A0A7J6M593_PERCH|nr:hypothetical protein FOL47_003948 [Perkinsus chesapeaki]